MRYVFICGECDARIEQDTNMLPLQWVFIQIMNIPAMYFCGTKCARKGLKKELEIPHSHEEIGMGGH